MHRRTYVQFHYLGGDTCQSSRKATAVMTNKIITASCSITIIVASYDVINVCGPDILPVRCCLRWNLRERCRLMTWVELLSVTVN